ncbi:MAG: hypothetical protein P8Y71_24350 [Pseudolabrys sp.]
MSVNDYSDDVPVPAFVLLMICTRCGAIGADARPNWAERAVACTLDERQSGSEQTLDFGTRE